MMAIALFFGLIVWITITILFMRIGYQMGVLFNCPKVASFIVFMIMIGGWVTYGFLEYGYKKQKIEGLCKKEGGVKTYITPEDWKKTIDKRIWQDMKPLSREKSNELYELNKNNVFDFENRVYYYDDGYGVFDGKNFKNILIEYKIYDRFDDVVVYSAILVDDRKQQVLLKMTEFSDKKFISDFSIWSVSSWYCGSVDDGWKRHLLISQYLNNSFKYP